MADRIKGITIEIGGDTTGLSNALKDVNSNIKNTESQLKDVERLLKLDPSNTELLSQKQRLLTQAINETKEKLETLKTAEQQAQQQFAEGRISQEQYEALQREIIATEQSLQNLETQAGESAEAIQRISEAGDAVEDLENQAGQAAAAVQRIAEAGDAVQKAGEKIESAGKKMLPVTAGITALGSAGVAAAMELDDGYDTIITKTGATGEALKELNQVAEDLFTSMPVEMADAGTAVGEINTRFAVTGDKLRELSEDFIKFAEINGTDLNDSIGKADKIMEQYGIDLSETGNVLGLITKKGQETGISVDTLMDSLQKNGATFKEMGLNMVQSTDLLAQFEANGVNAETAMAGLRKSIKAYTDEGKSTSEALSLTIDSIKNAKNETEALSIAQEIFGTKGAAEMATAIREGRVDLESLSSSMKDYGTVVSDTFDSTQDPWDEAKIAVNNLKLAAADLGSALLSTLQPMLTSIVDKVKEFTQWFTSLSQSQKEVIIKVAALVVALGPALIIIGKTVSAIGKVMTAVKGMEGAIKTAKTAFTALKAAMLANPIVLVIAAITALVAAFIYLWNTNEDFRQFWIGLWDALKETVGKVVDTLVKFFTETIPHAWESLKSFFKGIPKWWSDLWKGVASTATNIWGGIKNSIGNFVSGIKNDLETKFNAAKDAVVSTTTSLKEKTVSKFSEMAQGIKQKLDPIQKMISEKFESGKEAALRITEKMKDSVVTWAMKLSEMLGINLEDLPEVIKDGFEKALEYIKGLPKKAVEWGKDFVKGLVEGIKSGLKWIKDSAKNIASTISKYLHFSRPDTGPLHYYEEWMPHMIKGLAAGIKSNMWRVTDQVRTMAGQMNVSMTGMQYGTQGSTATGTGNMDPVITLLSQYLPSIAAQKYVTLDGKAIVGQTVNEMDRQLEGIREMRVRTI